MMKILLYILFCIALLIVFIVLSAVKIRITFTMREFCPECRYTFSFFYGIIRFKKKEGKKAKKKEKKKAKEKPEKSTSDFRDNPLYYLDIVAEFIKTILKFCKNNMVMHEFRFKLIYSSANPFIDGLSFSAVTPVVYSIYSVLNGNVKLRHNDIEVRPDFSNKVKSDIDLFIYMRISVLGIIKLIAAIYKSKEIKKIFMEIFK